MTSFQDILKKPSSEIEAPAALPIGTYLCVADGLGEIGKIGKNQTECINFKLKPMQAQPDVDQEALMSSLKGKGLAEKMIRHRLFGTEEAVWRLRQFLDHLGIDDVGGTKSLGERLMEVPGKQVLVNLGHRPSDDGTQIFQEVKSTAKV